MGFNKVQLFNVNKPYLMMPFLAPLWFVHNNVGAKKNIDKKNKIQILKTSCLYNLNLRLVSLLDKTETFLLY